MPAIPEATQGATAEAAAERRDWASQARARERPARAAAVGRSDEGKRRRQRRPYARRPRVRAEAR
eukprot:4656743-Pleurochrysis_carterae.AAC.1